MLTVTSLSKRYKKLTILSGITHKFEPGVTVITGMSGAGKSTLLRLCASAEKPTSGDIKWKSTSILHKPKTFRRVLGYAPQRIDFPEDISALDFLSHIGALKGFSRAASLEQGQNLLTRIGLGHDGKRLIRSFSGGMRRRLGLAQAFLGQPECLILDEPTAELDPATAELIHGLIFEAGQRAVVLMTTHLTDGLTAYDYQSFEVSRQTS